MKRKLLIITLCFTIVFSSLNIKKSYANPVISTAGYVISKEAFNVIVGFGALCGIASLKVDSGNFDSASGDFVERVLDSWTSLRVDSGEFKTVSQLEEEIKNGSSKDPKDDKKISLSSSLISTLLLLFDDVKEKEVNGIFSNNNIPFYPSSYDFTSETPLSPDFLLIDLPGNSFVNVGLKTTGYLDILYNYRGEVKSFSTSAKPILTYYPCKKASFNSCDTHDTHNIANWYHLGAKTSSSVLKFGSKDYVYYISTNEYMSNYNKDYTDNFIINNDIPDLVNPNITVDGNIDIPSNGGNNGSTSSDPLEPPKFPNLQDFDFSGLNLDSLVDVFSNFRNKFPFSLPFDLLDLITGFVADPLPPIFEVDIFGSPLTLDLTEFDELANIVRMFVLLGYVISLMFITKKFGG